MDLGGFLSSVHIHGLVWLWPLALACAFGETAYLHNGIQAIASFFSAICSLCSFLAPVFTQTDTWVAGWTDGCVATSCVSALFSLCVSLLYANQIESNLLFFVIVESCALHELRFSFA